MDELEYDVEDDYDRLHSVDCNDHLVDALESLKVFVASIESNGLSKSDYQTLQLIDNELYDSLPAVGYTAQPSKQGLTSTIKTIYNRSKELLTELFIALIELIDRVISFIASKIFSFKKKPADQALAYGNQEILKSQAAYIKLLERRIAELEKANIPESMKEQKRQIIDTITSETHPSVSPIAAEADKTYSVLVRSVYKHPEQLNTYLSYATIIPMLAKISVSMVDNIDRLFNLIRDVGNKEAIANAIVTLTTLTRSFQDLLAKTCSNLSTATAKNQQKYAMLALPHVHFSHGSDPVDYVRSVRDALLVSSSTPSGIGFKQEYPGDLSEITAARVKIGDQLQTVDSVFADCEDSFSELLARSRELGQYIKEHKGIPHSQAEMDPELKRELIQANRSLQKTITTILRLRNLTDVIRNSVQKQISYSIRRINAAGAELGKV